MKVQEIALAVSLLIILSCIESSTAQSDDNKIIVAGRRLEITIINLPIQNINNYNSLFLILFFVIIVGIIVIWKLTYRKKIEAISLQK